MRIVVRGQPAPQGSKTGFVNKKTGRVILKESSDKVKPWREAVKWAAIMARGGENPPYVWPMDCAIRLRIVFTFARPQSHYRSGKNVHMLKDSAPHRPSGTPDLSKLARAVEDALTDAGVWRDDARVVEYDRLAKVYVCEDHEALDSPGAIIVLEAL